MVPAFKKLAAVTRGDTWRGLSRLRYWIRTGDGQVCTGDPADVGLTLSGHGYTVGTRLVVGDADGAGLLAHQQLYVVAVDGADFQVSGDAGGTPLAISAGTVRLHDAAPPTVALDTCRIEFRLDKKDGPVIVLALSSELPEDAEEGDVPGLVIEDSADWDVSVPRVLGGFSRAGTLYWDWHCVDEDGAVITPVEGTIPVKGDVTK